MKYLILGLSLLLVTGCEYTVVKKSQDFFERNQKCYEHKDEVEKNYKHEDEDGKQYVFSGPFYSPKVNSCVFLTKDLFTFIDERHESCDLIDVFTQKLHYSSGSYVDDISIYEKCREIIEEYKNE